MERTSVLASGLFRSGTNYLQRLIDLNLDCKRVHPHPVTGNLPQKHASRIEGMRDHYAGLRIALVHKPPAKWVDSICRQSFDLVDHYDLGYEPGHTVIEIPYDDEHDPLPDRVIIPVSLEKLCDHYVRFHRFWMSEQRNWPFIAVAHALAAFEPEKCVCQLAEAFELPRRSFEPVRGTGTAKPGA